MQIIDNVLPVSLQNFIEDLVKSPEFKWTYLQDATHGEKDNNTNNKIPAFSHTVLENNSLCSPFSQNFQPLVMLLAENCNLDFKTLERIRIGMYLPLGIEHKHNNIHVDAPYPHTVVIYYINDSDAATYFFDNNNNVIKTVFPKKGRCVVFNGSIKHASSLPNSGSRFIMNLNFSGLQI